MGGGWELLRAASDAPRGSNVLVILRMRDLPCRHVHCRGLQLYPGLTR